MICSLRSHRNTRQLSRASLSRGFTLLELLIVVGIVIILSALAVPVIQNTMRVYAMRSAISSITGVISSTRYQAIFNGCQSQLVITKANFSYQIQSENPGVGGATCNAAFANVGGLTPFQGKSIALNADITLTFRPSGAVASTPVANPITLILSNTAPGSALLPENIQVSTYGNITVTP
jgi:prepilin-type N-terminal cleavage/methylation domain-containing protein